jgi:hypothetical protein
MPQVLPGAQSGVGVLTTFAFTCAEALVVFAEEVYEVAANPTRARTRTKLRIAMFFMVYFSLAVTKLLVKDFKFFSGQTR